MKEAPLEEVEVLPGETNVGTWRHSDTGRPRGIGPKLEVDGVHLGKTDMPVAEARQLLGEAFIIGRNSQYIWGCRNTIVQEWTM